MRQIVDEIGQKVGEYESNFTVNFPGKSRKSGGNSRGCDRCRKLILFPLPPASFHFPFVEFSREERTKVTSQRSSIAYQFFTVDLHAWLYTRVHRSTCWMIWSQPSREKFIGPRIVANNRREYATDLQLRAYTMLIYQRWRWLVRVVLSQRKKQRCVCNYS